MKLFNTIKQLELHHISLIKFVVGIVIILILFFSGILEQSVISLRNLGYVGIFLLGFFYTSAFTTPYATTAYILLHTNTNPFIGGMLGGLGAMMIDAIIYKISERGIGKVLFVYHHKKYRIRRIKNKLLIKISPLLAGFILASPLPDELAAVILGLERYNFRRFLFISFAFNSIGIFSLLALGQIF